MTEEVAYIFHFPPSELKQFTVQELVRWHKAGIRINKQVHG